MQDEKKYCLLIVDDENTNILTLTHILDADYTVLAVKSGENAIKVAEKQQPDLILLDIVMPDMNGHAVAGALKSLEKTRDIPIIFVTGLNNTADEELGLSLGAVDYISKPFSEGIVKLRVQNQIRMLEQLRLIEKMSYYDQLTSIPNRRAFDDRITMEWNRTTRENKPISILVADVDNFKAYNDTYGHQQGDAALRTVAQTLSGAINRSTDFTARWGGEEFIMLLPNTDLDGALHIADKIRLNVSNTDIPCSDGSETRVTLSIGVNSVFPVQGSSYDEFISLADKALYSAKESGRNRVCGPGS